MDQHKFSLNRLKNNELKEKSEIKISGDIIIFDNADFFDDVLIFENKIFTCRKIKFESINKEIFNVHFENCTFDCDVEFDSCTFTDLRFTSCNIKSNDFFIQNSDINCLAFKENKRYSQHKNN